MNIVRMLLLFILLLHFITNPCDVIKPNKNGPLHLIGQQKTNTQSDDQLPRSLKRIIEYLILSHDKDTRSLFTTLHVEQKRAILEKMNIAQYGWFLNAFSEDQWQKMWQELPPQERSRIPKTKLEQLLLIRDVWMECSSGNIRWPAKQQGDPAAQDLVVWRDKALKSIFWLNIDRNKLLLAKQTRAFESWVSERFTAKMRTLLKGG